MRTLNTQLITLSRVVLHPSFRGAGVAASFVRKACELSGYAWVETMAQMGHVNPFFEKAGFVRVGVSQTSERSRFSHSRLYGNRQNYAEEKGLISTETFNKSRYANPVYYIFDNRRNAKNNTHSQDDQNSSSESRK